MKLYLLLILSVSATVALMFLIHTRTEEQQTDQKRNRFQTIKLRMTTDVLADIHAEHDDLRGLVEQAKLKVKELEDEVAKLKPAQGTLIGDMESCKESGVRGQT